MSSILYGVIYDAMYRCRPGESPCSRQTVVTRRNAWRLTGRPAPKVPSSSIIGIGEEQVQRQRHAFSSEGKANWGIRGLCG